MRTISTIKREIVELSAIKSTYCHYLASYEAQTDVENTTQVEANKKIVSENLRKLYAELAQHISQEPNNQQTITTDKNPHNNDQPTTPNPTPDTRRMKFKPYVATELEQRAIMLFNSDKRYTITE